MRRQLGIIWRAGSKWAAGAAVVTAAATGAMQFGGARSSVMGSAMAAPGGGGACGATGSSRLLAEMPLTQAEESFPPTGPTYPEGIAVINDLVVTSGPANFGTAGNGSPTQLTVFNRKTGALVSQVPVVGEDLSQEHALSELFAHKNYLYSVNSQLGVVRWKVEGQKFAQETVSTPACSVSLPVPCHVDTNKCPANVKPYPPLLNGVVVDKGGDAYFTDSLQGIIWHVPATKKGDAPVAPEVFFCSAELQGSGEGLAAFGANGVAVIGDWIYVANTFGAPDPDFFAPTSQVYRVNKNNPTSLELVYNYRPAMIPNVGPVPALADGIRYAPESNRLYVVLAGANQVSALDVSNAGSQAAATEVARFGRTDPDHPFQNPSTIAVLPDGTAYVPNHAILCSLADDPTNPAPQCYAPDFFGVFELCVK